MRIAERRRTALFIIRSRPLDAVHRITEHGIALTEIIEQRGKRRELARMLVRARLRASMFLRQAMTCARVTVRSTL
jgi:IS5 family transposase